MIKLFLRNIVVRLRNPCGRPVLRYRQLSKFSALFYAKNASFRSVSAVSSDKHIQKHGRREHRGHNSADEDILTKSPLQEDIQRLYRKPSDGHRLFLVQPRVKVKSNFETQEVARLKMEEAVALVQTLPNWTVAEMCVVSVKSLQSNQIFGSGSLEKLKEVIEGNQSISALFVGIDMLTALQNAKLEEFFRVPVFDRYQIVLRIFHDHARTKEAKLQLALAEIPYLRVKLSGFSHTHRFDSFQSIARVGGSGESTMEIRKRLLFDREVKIKKSLEKLKKQRQKLRQNEGRKDMPVVAVVGYTNCGKTTLIKSLTDDACLVPENKLFATLDVTLHAGFLPSSQKVLYIDTVGFISDVPTALIESFKATLEDVVFADVIVHVRDISHPDTEMQKEVVLKTLASLELPEKLLDSIVEVGNKVDLCDNLEAVNSEDLLLISATEGTNLQNLASKVEETIFENTDNGIQLFRIPNGGEEYSWLFKQAAIKDARVDSDDFNYLIIEAVISSANLAKFKHSFGDLTVSMKEATEM